mgnify:CR=1 FL=1
MYLSKIFRNSLILLDMEFSDFDGILVHFSEKMEKETGINRNEILDRLRKREEVLSTYVGNNTSLPHGRFPDFDGLVAGYLRLKTPITVSHGSRDEELRHVICVVTGTKNEAHYLSFLSVTSQIISELPDFLTSVASAEAFIGKLGDLQHQKLHALTAGDLAVKLPQVTRAQTIREIVDMMKKEQTTFHPVVDDQQKVCGVVSVTTLLKAGLPDYIMNLTDLSFIKEFKPLDKFWDSEDQLVIADYMENAGEYLVTASASYLEVLFLMCKHNKNNLVTVDADGRYAGVITQASILNKMLRP